MKRAIQLVSLRIAFLAILMFAFFPDILAQEKSDSDFGIKIHGFVKTDFYLDTRQVTSAREGHFLIFPKQAEFDRNGDDINATPNVHLLAIQTRLKGVISGPDFFNMKTSGLIEASFFGNTESDINGLRLRHAFIKLENDKLELLLGQYWNPMFVTDCFPGTLSFNTGTPFQPFSRNPQIRLSTKGNVRFIGALMSQRDFASRGPSGTSTAYLRNSGIPNMHAQLQLRADKIIGGIGLDYKVIKPSLVDAIGNKTNTTVSGVSALAYLKYSLPKVTIKLEAVYGENTADLLMLSGIAEKSVNMTTGEIEYTPCKVMSVWFELSGGTEKMEWGLFSAYTQSLGLKDPLGGSVYALGGNIDHMWRVAPRLAFKSGKTKLGIELEATNAQYGTMVTGKDTLETEGIDSVTNLRILFIAMYSF